MLAALPVRSMLASALLALGACGPLTVDDDGPVTDRRLYVNDRAPNDSLKAQVLRNGGVRFVLQPGKPYRFSVATARTSDVLDVYSLEGGQKAFRKIPAIHDGGKQVFLLNSPFTSAIYFRARLLPEAGSASLTPNDVEAVTLESQGDTMLDTLQVKLFFVQALRNLPTTSSKSSFAAAFFNRMNDVLRPYGIAVAGLSESVNPTLGPLTFPFSNYFVQIGGTREPNHASLYLVDSISVDSDGTSPNGLVLGFAPREVKDLSEDPESRVILANRATVSELALTAVHELGHFFGLRHTVSTWHDMLQDEDFSNVEDGFTDTRFCRIDQADPPFKIAASAGEAGAPGDRSGLPVLDRSGGYCLRVAAGDNSCSVPSCDLDNLMHPVDCGYSQLQLSAQQVEFLKRNMTLYRR